MRKIITEHAWDLRVSEAEYGELDPAELKRIQSLAVSKPYVGKSGWVTFAFHGPLHLELAVEIALYVGLILES